LTVSVSKLGQTGLSNSDTLSIFQKIISLVMDIEFKVQNTYDQTQKNPANAMATEEFEIYGSRMLEYIQDTRKYCTLIKLMTSANTMKVDLESKFPEKMSIAETMQELILILMATIDSYINFVANVDH